MTQPLTPDPQLVARLRAGDRAAFETLFRSYFRRLASYALGLVGTPDAAEDVVQEVFARVWLARDRLSLPDNIGAYLYRAVRNRSLNQLRRVKMLRPLDSVLEQERADGTTADPPERAALQREMQQLVDAAVRALPPRTREVFVLSRTHGLTYPEIAAAMGISIKTVETLMGRALKALRERLRIHR